MATQIKSLNVEQLAIKDRYTLVIDGKNTGFLAKEKYKDGTIKWYPFKFYQGYAAPERKYSNIEFIGTSCGKVPVTGFSQNIKTGYGFTKDQGVDKFFRYLEDNTKSKLTGVIFTKDKTYIAEGVLFISIKDFFKIQLRTKLFVESSRKEQKFLHQTLLYDFLPEEIEQPSKIVYTPGALERFIAKYAEDTIHLNSDDAKSIINKLDIDKQILLSTKRTIDKIYIEDVLRDFKKLISQKSDTPQLEERWHQFFRNHPWIFSSVFAYPAAYFKDKLNIGGHDISGSTDKIIDFLIKNKFTKNITFIEIKTHLTPLLIKSPYRKPNIYSVSSHVSGAIVQVIDQKTTFLKNYHAIKGDSDIDSLNSNCLIIIGNTNELDIKGRRDSFELFRLSNKDVAIVTFDELQEKIEALINIFAK